MTILYGTSIGPELLIDLTDKQSTSFLLPQNKNLSVLL